MGALDEFLARRMASSLGPDQKAQTRQGVEHLENALVDAGIPLEEFVADDGLVAYVDELEKRVSPGYLAHLSDIMRQAFRFMCSKGLLALDFSRCAVPSQEKDPHDFSKLESGFPECFEGIYPASLMLRHTARSIRMNRAVPKEIVEEFRLVVANIPDLKRNATAAAWWFVIRQLALDMRLKSLKELCTVEGACRLMDYFLRNGYVQDAITIRKLRSWFKHMENLGLSDPPFKLKVRKGGVIKYVIEFRRLPARTAKQHFFRIHDRRHTRIDGEGVECCHTTDEMRKIAQYGNLALKGWRSRRPEELPEVFRDAQDIVIARTGVFYPPRPIEFWSMKTASSGP